ncbi:hypothetical protein CHGG_05984 [Chaetomium globosum CBS 148.51]|uniref:Transcription factor domain-containing protein n=1 Tax=Chaetomium globosum (strain ATCC 6205 / CBS 148.51 / DSM 1962 / NBRC 6347 / NRRL 1970) TaxID=306901 RepID=Q2H5T1_CHAGB|nr:uncharacterized protein CHGG_05984 [Chaetomium globosum CBS 148.51]EAQ89365.1 hypothetical protein CHGG_05984 [Chaetomium globosum CBS 148.51]
MTSSPLHLPITLRPGGMRELDTEQTGYPVTSLPPIFPRPRGTGTRRPRNLSIEQPYELPVKSLKAASTAARRPPKKMEDIPVTPSTQPPESYNDLPTVSPPGGSNLGGSLRKERGAIAAQCSTCQKFRLECNYREPQPTKKDKTMVEILDRIKSLEVKLDNLSQRSAMTPSILGLTMPASLPSPLPTTLGSGSVGQPTDPPFQFPNISNATPGGDNQYRYVSSVHQMLKWPAMQQLLMSIQPKLPNIDLSVLEREGPASMVALRRSSINSLPTDPSTQPGRGSTISVHGSVAGQNSITVSDLNWETMQRLAKAYFDSFNLLCPVLNRQPFVSETLPALFNRGFDDSMASTIAFLVFALGEVAIAGYEGSPIHVYNGRASGIKGGTKEAPPGLHLFNEARRRMGFNLTSCSLENVQIFELASGLNLELGFPLTGLERMESTVGLPDFSGPYMEDDHLSNQESHFQEHFASQIVLRRLLVDFHGALNVNQSHTDPSTLGQMSAGPFSPAPPTYPSVNETTIRPLATQLEEWRGMLPAHLRWHDDAPGVYPNAPVDLYTPTTVNSLFTPATTPISPAIPTTSGGTTTSQQRQLHQPPTSATPTAPRAPTAPLMFTADLDAPATRYPYVLDVQVALLRSRYYYTKYLIHRPFVYKALHHPTALSHTDAAGRRHLPQSRPQMARRHVADVPQQAAGAVLVLLHAELLWHFGVVASEYDGADAESDTGDLVWWGEV